MLTLLFKQQLHAKTQPPPIVAIPAPGKSAVTEQAPAVVPVESPIFGVLGAKGGAGATTIAVNLAAACAAKLTGATLLDANIQQPDAANMLNLSSEYSLVDLVARTEFSAEVLHACCAEKHAGRHAFQLLGAPADGEAALKLNLTQVAGCLDHVRKFSPCWVIDLPRQLDRHLVTLLDRCSSILIVFEPTLTGLGAARRWLRVVDELGYSRQRINLVINRSGSKLRITEEEISSLLEGMNVFKLPNAFTLTEEAAAEGVPAFARSPKSPYARAVAELASRLCEFATAQTGHAAREA